MNLFDISIILIYLSIIFILGIYSRKYIDNFSDFMIAGQKRQFITFYSYFTWY